MPLLRWAPLFAAATVLLASAALPCFAGDTILFHDGMRTLCTGRAWEEKDQVHCEYRGGVLTYPRKEVLRIEKDPAAATQQEPAAQGQKTPSVPAGPKATFMERAKPLPIPTPSAPKGSGGPLFYDPRRPKRYWSSPTRHHDTYEQAVAALSAEFGKPLPWIEERLADTNDLNEIRKRLQGEFSPPIEGGERTGTERLPSASGIEFYNPRRPKRYWTSPEAQHETLAEALQALAREFGKAPEWVERHMGEANDTGLIRHALREALDAGKP